MSESLSDRFNNASSTQVMCGTLGAVGVAVLATKFIQDPHGFTRSMLGSLIRAAKHVPGVAGAVDAEVAKTLADLERDLRIEGDEVIYSIPEEGWDHEKILGLCNALKDAEENKWKDGKVSGCVYHGGDAHVDMQNEVYGLFSLTNPLHPDVFPSIRKFESEVISMTKNMMHGDDKVCGATTSGGTESILMACKAHRDYYHTNKGITRPEMVVPVSAHAAFDKAAHYFGIKLVHIPLNDKFEADVAKMRAAINSNTVLLVGSAPSYAHGMVDPIPEIAALAEEFGIGCHVDACLGGFLLPWFNELGEDSIKLPLFDFRLSGVTSMSADTHKYGYSVKGSSVVLYKNRDLRESMFFVTTEWPGGIYCSPTIAGSRAGGLIAATWASLVSVGRDGFLKHARAIWETKEHIKRGIQQMDGLKLVGDSHTMVVAFDSDDKNLSIFGVMQCMTDLGWNLNALQKPNSVHICCTYKHAGKHEEFLANLQASVDKVRSDPAKYKGGAAHVYGLAYGLPDRSTVRQIVVGFLDVILKA